MSVRSSLVDNSDEERSPTASAMSSPAAHNNLMGGIMNNMLQGIGMNLDVQKMAQAAVKAAVNPHDLGLTGFYPDVIEEVDQNGRDVDPRITGSQFCQELHNTYEGKFKRMYPMTQHNYQQVIPNPDRPDELFVIQYNLDLTDEKITPEELEEAKEFEDGKSLAQKRMKYKLVPLGGGQSDDDSDYGSESDDNKKQDAAAEAKGELYKDTKLFKNID